MGIAIMRRSRGIGYLDTVLNAAQSGASLVGAAKQGAAQLGATVGNIASNYLFPPLGLANKAGQFFNNLIGDANSQTAMYTYNAVSNALGGDIGDFFGGVTATAAGLLDTTLNFSANLLDAVGLDTSKWFKGNDDGECVRETVTIGDRSYSGLGPDEWLQRYRWKACDNDHADIRLQHNIERFLPGTGPDFAGRDYSRGLVYIESGAKTPQGWTGWREYATARARDKSLHWKDTEYYANGYNTADIYRKDMQARGVVRVPTGGILWETAGHGGVKIADAVEKSIHDLTRADIQMMIAYNALPSWLALQIANGDLVPVGETLKQDLSNAVLLPSAPNTTTTGGALSSANDASGRTSVLSGA